MSGPRGDVELEEFAATLQAFLDLQGRPGAVDESPAGDCEAPGEEPGRAAKKADAFMDLIRTALQHADDGHAAGDDRYLVHLVQPGDAATMSTLDGRPLCRADAHMVGCDTATPISRVFVAAWTHRPTVTRSRWDVLTNPGRLSLLALAEEEFAVGVVNEHGVVVDQGPGTDHPDRAGGMKLLPTVCSGSCTFPSIAGPIV
jgi:hypothetical protein